MEDPEDLISVYQAANAAEAHLVKNLLADSDIDSSVSEENEPLAGLPMVPPDVLVRRRDVERAEAIIAEYEEHQIERAERPDWKCPACHADVPGSFDECDACGAARPV